MVRVVEQTAFIHEFDWDLLIILDSCRYDYFQEEVGQFLDGKLFETWSPADCTPKWFSLTFPDRYEFTVISANPTINSWNIEVSGYNAVDHFEEVLDAWRYSIFELGVTPPSIVNKLIRASARRRQIAFYLQPHQPYMMPLAGELKALYSYYVLPKEFKALGQREPYEVEAALFVQDPFLVRQAYRLNLRWALASIRELLNTTNFPLVMLTSDHGECLGEGGRFGHALQSTAPEEHRVPVFLIGENSHASQNRLDKI